MGGCFVACVHLELRSVVIRWHLTPPVFFPVTQSRKPSLIERQTAARLFFFLLGYIWIHDGLTGTRSGTQPCILCKASSLWRKRTSCTVVSVRNLEKGPQVAPVLGMEENVVHKNSTLEIIIFSDSLNLGSLSC